ncbi:hypothetical protein LINPERHAP2_LOCUS31563 [Linum perenne]
MFTWKEIGLQNSLLAKVIISRSRFIIYMCLTVASATFSCMTLWGFQPLVLF